MRQLLPLIIVLLLSPQIFLRSQSSIGSQAKLVHRYEERCGYSCAQELAIDLGGSSAKDASNKVAIRFCSREPFPVALSTSAAAYSSVITILQDSYGYTPERVLFLRAEACVGSHAGITATEFWDVPKGAALPGSVETTSANSIRIDSTTVKSRHGYQAALKKLKDKLLTDSQVVGVVVGSYYKAPSPLMKQRLRIAKETLDRSKLQRGRYFVRLAPWTGEYSLNSPEPKYPSIFVVEGTKAKAENSARR
jgi:hypothetical protein